MIIIYFKTQSYGCVHAHPSTHMIVLAHADVQKFTSHSACLQIFDPVVY